MTDDLILGALLRRIIAQSDRPGYGGYRHWEKRYDGGAFLTLDLSVDISLDELAALDRADQEVDA